jgi:hypothetical protein
MNKVGIPASFQEAIFATTAAVLHMGNIQFVEGKESDSSMVAPGAAQQHLAAAGKSSMRLFCTTRHALHNNGMQHPLPQVLTLQWLSTAAHVGPAP